jgi:protein-S-isoprenylcysteine O-methyltransferase Ste14
VRPLRRVGVAVILGTLMPFFVPPLYAWIIWVQFIRIEEVTLSLRFGEAYSTYAERVRCWL